MVCGWRGGGAGHLVLREKETGAQSLNLKKGGRLLQGPWREAREPTLGVPGSPSVGRGALGWVGVRGPLARGLELRALVLTLGSGRWGRS